MDLPDPELTPPIRTHGTQAYTLMHGGHLRRYLVYVPSCRVAPSAWPVVLLLHGAGADPQWMIEETGWHRTADEEQCLLIVPAALPFDPTRPPSFKQNPPLWNDGSARAQSAPRQVEDVAFVMAVLHEVARHYPLHGHRLGVTGFSNGAAMTFALAAQHAERFCAIAPVSGYCWLEEPRLSRPVPTFYLVGTEDPLVPLRGGAAHTPWGWVDDRPSIDETLTTWARALSWNGERRDVDEEGIEQQRYLSGPGGADLLVWKIQGLGHHWPGGRGLLSRRLFGPPSARVRANDSIVAFFRQQAP